ncbi:YgdI/YgdR family lipoprotein [Candidatus Symbiopectobacterium sp. 'North America']|uniref:YgdI/YgdR family lipoprotein n=1 Tax=Candidatus Symbiopectobacterium sp. 'North America' TaxID=2794574 RepID=UPI0018CB3D6F|nr:YgdI/YgdR family lipoprotein [Candidatus Symbiopectobacterium sp. 'North America']MBG6244068.1 YgdI/YgdR family lipoprotein [Candidatus Symbiopectobacterium sp. 'North America']
MKNKIAIIAIAMATLSLITCSSNYVLHTNDGRTIVAEGKPKVDEDTGMISYVDAYGHEQQINSDNLKEMVEAK